MSRGTITRALHDELLVFLPYPYEYCYRTVSSLCLSFVVNSSSRTERGGLEDEEGNLSLLRPATCCPWIHPSTHTPLITHSSQPSLAPFSIGSLHNNHTTLTLYPPYVSFFFPYAYVSCRCKSLQAGIHPSQPLPSKTLCFSLPTRQISISLSFVFFSR